MTRADLRHLTAPVSALIFCATVYMHERDIVAYRRFCEVVLIFIVSNFVYNYTRR